MARTFSKSLRVGLMVGIGGGIPTPENDVRLGDVVISCPVGTYGGVVQYDMGKHVADAFTRTGSLNSPPRSLLTAISRLRADELADDPQYYDYIQSATDRTVRTKKLFRNPGPEGDRLFKVENDHPTDESSCDACPSEWEVVREAREDDLPRAHYGLIASGNSVIKDARSRQKLGEEIGALCFEMEAAGLMLDFPCIVIRGICDYSDSHKNKQWQGYAALVAASYAKELLGNLPHSQVTQEWLAVDICHSIENLNDSVRGTNERLDKAFDQQASQFYQQRETEFVGEHQKCHKALKTSNYESFKDINPSRASGTCRWVLENPTYLNWRDSLSNSLLWVSADPGCGKSVLSKSLIDINSNDLEPRTIIAQFFFKDNEVQNRLNVALCAVLHQIFAQEPALISHAMDLYNKTGYSIKYETSALWDILLKAVAGSKASQIICVLDALDECHTKDVEVLIQKLREVFGERKVRSDSEMKARLKFFVTSRPYLEIQALFSSLTDSWPQIRLRGEEESDQIKKEIDIVIRIKMQQVAREAGLSPEEQKKFETELLQMENRTYLWLHLAIEDIRTTLSNSVQPDSESIRHIPPTVDAAYANILARVQASQLSTVKTILLIICGARRPLTIQEMAIALGIALKPESSNIHSVQLDPSRLSARIRSLCGLFVIITNSRIHLLHQTAKEFLVRDDISVEGEDLTTLYPLGIAETESTLAEICVRFLLMEDFCGSHYRFKLWCYSDSKFKDCPEHPAHGVYTFLQYAAEQWARHVRHMSSHRYNHNEKLISQLYDTSSQTFLVWFELFWQTSGFGSFWSLRVAFNPQIDPLCLAALNGHENLLRKFLLGKRKEDSHHWTARNERNPIYENETCAFIWAAWAGYYDICCILLNQGARLHSFAAQAALFQGNTNIFQLFSERGGDSSLDLEDALRKASWDKDLGAVRSILEAGSSLNDGSGVRRVQAVEDACFTGSIDMARFLLDRGAGIDTRGSGDDVKSDALYFTCFKGNLDLAELILERGAQVDGPKPSSPPPLVAACNSGNVDIVRLLIAKGASLTKVTCLIPTPLEVVCRTGSIKIARTLIEGGADVNAPSSDQSSCLSVALRNRHMDIALLLLDHGAHPDMPEDEMAGCRRSHNTALQAACRQEIEAQKLILDRGACINARIEFKDTALATACKFCDVDIIELLLQTGADADPGAFVAAAHRVEVMKLLRHLRSNLNGLSENNSGTTALEAACSPKFSKEGLEYLLKVGAGSQTLKFQRTLDRALLSVSGAGQPRGVEMLLDAGANVRFHDESTPSALECAAKSGCTESMRLIIKRGAEIGLKLSSLNERPSPLELACWNSHYAAVELLLTEADNDGTCIEISDVAYGRALQIACLITPSMMKLLLRGGANVNFHDDEMKAALHVASRFFDLDIMQVLLESGADPDLPSLDEGYPLRIICTQDIDPSSADRSKSPHKGNPLDAIQMLLRHGANINGHSGLDNTTALIEACRVGRIEIVMLLLREGADVNAVDKHQLSALILAAAKGHVHIVRELLRHGADVNYRRAVANFDNDDEHQFALTDGTRHFGRDINSNGPWETALQAASACARDPNDDPMIDLLLENGAML
ncbi:unnamed protein product [Penicillium olsonii]|nr:unnamed protein product [Penicillium olsonii]